MKGLACQRTTAVGNGRTVGVDERLVELGKSWVDKVGDDTDNLLSVLRDPGGLKE